MKWLPCDTSYIHHLCSNNNIDSGILQASKCIGTLNDIGTNI